MTKQVDVCLVQVPYAPVPTPSLPLSLLKGYLGEAGISARVLYGALLFAEQIGLDVYQLVGTAERLYFLQEWTFFGAAFPDRQTDDDYFFGRWQLDVDTKTRAQLESIHGPISGPSLLLEVRRQATMFVARLADEILACNPKVVGCTVLSGQHLAALAVLRLIKERAPATHTMIGGPGCFKPMGRVVRERFPYVDFVVAGEADGFFASLCRRLVDGEGTPTVEPSRRTLPVVDGPSSRVETLGVSGPGLIDPPVFHDLERCPPIDCDDYFQTLNATSFAAAVRPALSVEFSRGCWWGAKHHCTFCGIEDAQLAFRSKSAEKVLGELEALTAKHGVKKFIVVDDILNLQFYETLLPRLKDQGAPYAFFFETKSNITRDQARLLADAGAAVAQPGIESLHTKTLRMIDKGATGIQQVLALRLLREYGVVVHWNYIISFPGEADAWHAETASWLPLISHIPPPPNVTPLAFLRYSPYVEFRQRYGLEIEPFAEYEKLYPTLSKADLADFAYFFIARNMEFNTQAAYGGVTEASFADRPGATALIERVVEWRTLHAKDPPPTLEAELADGRITIRDTRPVATAPEITLEGVAALVYEACDMPLRAEGITRAVQARHPDASWSTIEPVVTGLVERRLLLHLDGRYLALAYRTPVRPLNKAARSVGGVVSARHFVNMADRSMVRPFAMKSFSAGLMGVLDTLMTPVKK